MNLESILSRNARSARHRISGIGWAIEHNEQGKYSMKLWGFGRKPKNKSHTELVYQVAWTRGHGQREATSDRNTSEIEENKRTYIRTTGRLLLGLCQELSLLFQNLAARRMSSEIRVEY